MVRKEAFAPVAAIDYALPAGAGLRSLHRAHRLQRDPLGRGLGHRHYHVNGEIADAPISLILIFALGSLGIYGFIIGGWASESKYSLLGSMRTCAQMV